MVLLIDDEPAQVEYINVSQKDELAAQYDILQMRLHELSKQRQLHKNSLLSTLKSGRGTISKTTRRSALKKRGKKRRKKEDNLQFADEYQLVEIESWRQMSTDEYNSTWYSKSEFDEIKANNERESKLVKQSLSYIEVSMNAHNSKRGIEKLLDPLYHSQKKKNKRLLFDAIRVEQIRQRMLRKENPDAIRNISKTFTKSSKKLAVRRAEADAIFVEEMLKFEEDSCTCTPSVLSFDEDSISSDEKDERTDYVFQPIRASETKRMQPAYVDEPNSVVTTRRQFQNVKCLENGVVNYTLSPAGVDVDLYDSKCPSKSILSKAHEMGSKYTAGEEKAKKRHMFHGAIGIGDMLKCGAFEFPMVNWNRKKSDILNVGSTQFAIYDADGKRLWSLQKQSSANRI